MGKHPKLLIGFIVVAFVVIVGGLYSHKKSVAPTYHKQVSPFGDAASGDTNNETIRTLTATTQGVEKTQQHMQADMQKRDKASQNAMHVFEKKITDSMANFKQSIVQQLQHPASNNNPHTTHDPYGLQKKSGQGQMIGEVDDLTKHPAAGNHNTTGVMPGVSGGQTLAGNVMDGASMAAKKITGIPYFTIPPLATFDNVALMSALMGEVPVSGRLLAPALPFKAILGHQHMFAANGQKLPEDLAGMVIGGYSGGNQGEGCVNAYVTQILFVFNDGHFVSFPKKPVVVADKIAPSQALGYLSDHSGNACIPYAPHHGKYITNAPKVLGSLAGLSGIAGAGQAVAQSQTQTFSNLANGTSGTIVNGSLAKYAGGLFAGSAGDAALQWYKARVADSFDAVYIPNSWRDTTGRIHIQRVTFTPTKQLNIDLQTEGRKLVYDHLQNHHQHRGLD